MFVDGYEAIQIGLWEVFCTFTIEYDDLTVPTKEREEIKAEKNSDMASKMYYNNHMLSVKHTKLRYILNITLQFCFKN